MKNNLKIYDIIDLHNHNNKINWRKI